MKTALVLLSAIMLLLSSEARSQQASIVKFKDLNRRVMAQSDTTYVFNFFATWCEPCVAEFPGFQRFAEEFAGRRVKVVFVSLDFKKQFKKLLLPFLKKRAVKEDVLLLDETDYNTWIDRVDPEWDGNLPATLVVNNARHTRQMFARDFTYPALVSAVTPFIP